MTNSDQLALVQKCLTEVGIEIESAHDLYLLSNDKDRSRIQVAIPVLINLLPDLETSRLKREVAESLATKDCADAAAPPLLAELTKLRQELKEQRPYAGPLAWGIANALADTATESTYEGIVEILRDQIYGRSREMLPYALARIKQRREQTIAVLIDILEDEDVTAHAIDALGRMKATEALPYIRNYLNSEKYLIKKEAKKAVNKLGGTLRKIDGRSKKEHKGIKRVQLPTSETSLNVDLGEVPRLLKAVAAQIDQGLGASEISYLSERILMMEVDDERVFEYEIAFRAIWSTFQISVFMDDEDSPDVTFLGTRQVIDAVSKAIQEI